MLDGVFRLATLLHRIRLLLWLLVVSAVITFGAAIVMEASEGVMLAALAGSAWSGLLIAFGHFFAYRRIQYPGADAPFFARIRYRIAYLWAWAVLLTVVSLGGALLLLTVRAVGVLRG